MHAIAAYVVVMKYNASEIIDAMGGTTAVARLAESPISTVHSWRANGIPASRLAHLKLIASTQGIELPSKETPRP
ncbi:MAG: carph-isopro domain-containing protein [Shewanella sp.]